MDKPLERKNGEKVKRIVGRYLKSLGFSRTKPTFYTRLLDDRIEFVHLHKFTFGPYFRVHMGIRFLTDTFDSVVLNGVDSDQFGRRYNLEYDTDDESMELYAHEILRFVENEGISWLVKWRNSVLLLNDEKSPLESHFKEAYKEFILGHHVQMRDLIQTNMNLLGVKK